MKPAAQALLDKAAVVAASAEPAPSPCTSVCVMDPGSGWCKGCFRTLQEIGGWSELGDKGKRAVWTSLAARARSAPSTRSKIT